jgi:flagellar protein FlaG
MDIVAHKNSMAAQVLKYQTPQIAPVAVHRPITSQQAISTPIQPQADVSLADKELLEDAMLQMQDATQALQRNLNFSLDDSTGQMVVKVTDSLSGDVVRQMPTEEALRMAESLADMRSLLFKAQA